MTYQLVAVHSATATATAGALELDLSYADDANAVHRVLYGWAAGDAHSIGPQLDAFFLTHPTFPIAPYVPPTPSADPANYALSKRQICAALILSGKTTDPDGFITGVIANIPDATVRALALNDWQNAPYYLRGNPLFNDAGLLAAAGLTPEQVDAMWLLAKDQPK